MIVKNINFHKVLSGNGEGYLRLISIMKSFLEKTTLEWGPKNEFQKQNQVESLET